jgi:hypothetical protein
MVVEITLFDSLCALLQSFEGMDSQEETWTGSSFLLQAWTILFPSLCLSQEKR